LPPTPSPLCNLTPPGYATLEKLPGLTHNYGSGRSKGSSRSGSRGGTPAPSPGHSSGSSSPGGTAALQPHERPRYPPFDPHVHGVLYKLRAEDLDTLAKKEAGYVLKEFEVSAGALGCLVG